ncbi:MAG TPA: hypothetical protein VJ697_07210 [Nitrososphaeraceae archaeon]|nr:hypothetical protein [Nitrososphaeraceae archaeon]
MHILIVDSYAEWIIPSSSYEEVRVPKKMLATIFDWANKDGLEQMSQYWANEAKNAILLCGSGFTLSSAIEHARILLKYFTLSNAKINIIHNRDNDVLRNNDDDDYDYDEQTYMINNYNNNKDKDDNNLDDNNILIVVRHDMGKNFSFFWSRFWLHFFNLLKSRNVSVKYDATTISIKLDVLK